MACYSSLGFVWFGGMWSKLLVEIASTFRFRVLTGIVECDWVVRGYFGSAASETFDGGPEFT